MSPPIAFVCLLLVCMAAYGGSFAVGFSSDDYENIDYFRRMFEGKPELFFNNFTSTYLGNPLYGLHFRPLLQFPFILDFAVWKTNAWGWHLSNFALHWLCCGLVYLLSCRLLGLFRGDIAEAAVSNVDNRSSIQLMALASACLFAANPISAEAVNWTVGRVDSLCCFFVLATVYCYVRAGKFFRLASCVSFACALAVKESALVVPAVLCALALCRAETGKEALKSTALYWVVLITFFAIRQNALGALVGGYSSVSETLSPYLVLRFFSVPALKYYFLPVASTTLCQVIPQVAVLFTGYAAALVTAFINFRQKGFSEPVVRLCGFLGVWILLSLVPIAPVFLPHEDMTCNRWFYMPAVPFSLLVVVATMMATNSRWNYIAPRHSPAVVPGSTGFQPAPKGKQRDWRQSWTCVPAILMLLAYILLSQHNTAIWQRGTDFCASFNHAVVCFSRKSAGARPLIVGMPARINGVYIHHLLRTVHAAVLPPFMPSLLSDKQAASIQFLEPNWFMEQGVINTSALGRALANPDNRLCRIVVKPDGEAGVEELKLNETALIEPLALIVPSARVSSRVENRIRHITISLDRPVNPLQFPQLEVKFKGKAPTGIVFLYLKTADMKDFSNDHSRTLRPFVSNDRMVISVGELTTWSTAPSIDRICLSIPDSTNDGVEVRQVALSSDETMVPKLKPGTGLCVEADGVFTVSGNRAYVDYDASAIPGAAGVAVEIDGEVHRFLYLTGTYRDDKRSDRVKQTIFLDSVRGRFALPKTKSRDAEFYWYPIRVFALGADGQTAGLASDPLYVRLNGDRQ